jgi:hypothetical protein
LGHLSTVDVASVAEPDDGYEHDSGIDIRTDSPIADAMFSEITEFSAAHCLADAAGTVEGRDAVAQENQDASGNLGAEFSALPRCAVGEFNRKRYERPTCSTI